MPDDFGSLLRSMLGPPEPREGPPYAHTLAMPETEEEIAAQPCLPTFTVISRRRGRLHEFAPLETSAAFRRLSDVLLARTYGLSASRIRP